MTTFILDINKPEQGQVQLLVWNKLSGGIDLGMSIQEKVRQRPWTISINSPDYIYVCMGGREYD